MSTGWVTYPRVSGVKPSRGEEQATDNIVIWANIPVTDLERAMKFCGAVLHHAIPTVEGCTIYLNSHIHAQTKEA
jgi:predicted enzyme related to lactoylglutathione lyase